MKKKILSTLFLLAIVGQPAQAKPDGTNTTGKKVKDFASDVWQIVKPEWSASDKLLLLHQKYDKETDTYYYEFPQAPVLKVKSYGCRCGTDGHTTYYEKVTWDKKKNEKVDSMTFDCTKKVLRHKLNHTWILKRPWALIFWAGIATTVVLVTRKLYSEFAKKCTQGIVNELDEDVEENFNQKQQG